VAENEGKKWWWGQRGRLFCPQFPSGVEKEEREGTSGIKFWDFLDPKGAKDGSQHPGESAGGSDSPVHGLEFPAGERACKGDGDNEGEGCAYGDMVGDAAEEGEGWDNDGPPADPETA